MTRSGFTLSLAFSDEVQGCRYEGGLKKLLQAENAVAEMRAELIALQPKLEEAGRQVEGTMEVVNEQARAAEAQAQLVGCEETAASEAAAAAKAIKVTIRSSAWSAWPGNRASLGSPTRYDV
jgi:hypothetical protein